MAVPTTPAKNNRLAAEIAGKIKDLQADKKKYATMQSPTKRLEDFKKMRTGEVTEEIDIWKARMPAGHDIPDAPESSDNERSGAKKKAGGAKKEKPKSDNGKGKARAEDSGDDGVSEKLQQLDLGTKAKDKDRSTKAQPRKSIKGAEEDVEAPKVKSKKADTGVKKSKKTADGEGDVVDMDVGEEKARKPKTKQAAAVPTTPANKKKGRGSGSPADEVDGEGESKKSIHKTDTKKKGKDTGEQIGQEKTKGAREILKSKAKEQARQKKEEATKENSN